MKVWLTPAILALLVWAGATASAQSITQWYTDETSFTNDVTVDTRVDYPAPTTLSYSDYVEDGVHIFHALRAFKFGVGEYTTMHAGNEFVTSGAENVDIDLKREASAVGFWFTDGYVESAGGPCGPRDSEFRLTVRNGTAVVATRILDSPTDTPTFLGFTADGGVTYLEIREVGSPMDVDDPGYCENDYLGQILLGTLELEPPPVDNETGEPDAVLPLPPPTHGLEPAYPFWPAPAAMAAAPPTVSEERELRRAWLDTPSADARHEHVPEDPGGVACVEASCTVAAPPGRLGEDGAQTRGALTAAAPLERGVTQALPPAPSRPSDPVLHLAGLAGLVILTVLASRTRRGAAHGSGARPRYASPAEASEGAARPKG